MYLTYKSILSIHWQLCIPRLGVVPDLAGQSQDAHVVPGVDLGLPHRVQADVAVLAAVVVADAAAVAVDVLAVLLGAGGVQVGYVLGRPAPPVPVGGIPI